MAQIKIGEKTYEMTVAGSASISLKDILVFKREASVVGIDATWDDVEAIGTKDPKTLTTVDQALLMTVNLWLTLRAAGEHVTLDDAANIDLGSIEFIPDAEVEAAPFVPTQPPASGVADVPLDAAADSGA